MAIPQNKCLAVKLFELRMNSPKHLCHYSSLSLVNMSCVGVLFHLVMSKHTCKVKNILYDFSFTKPYLKTFHFPLRAGSPLQKAMSLIWVSGIHCIQKLSSLIAPEKLCIFSKPYLSQACRPAFSE